MHVFPVASGTSLGGWQHGHGFCGKDTTSQSSNCTCEHSACVQAMELVFVSFDENQRAFQRHYATMPWKALPFVDKGRKVSLRNRFVVNGHNIPKLVILDQKGLIIHDDGMSSVGLTSFAPPQPPALLSYDFLWAGVGLFTWSWSERSPPFCCPELQVKAFGKTHSSPVFDSCLGPQCNGYCGGHTRSGRCGQFDGIFTFSVIPGHHRLIWPVFPAPRPSLW